MVFNSVIERVRNNTMVKSGLEVYGIAKEVYNLVNNPSAADNEKRLNSVEEFYVCAAQKVTEHSEKKIKARLDYQVVHRSAQACRRVKSVSVGVKRVIKKRLNKTNDCLHVVYKRFKLLLRSGYIMCRDKIMMSDLVNSQKLRQLKIQLYNYQSKIHTIAKDVYTTADNFVGFEDCAAYTKRVSSDCISYTKKISTDCVLATKKVSNNVVNCGNSIKNKAIEGKNILVDVTANNLVSAYKIAGYSYGFAKQMVNADANALKIALDANRSLLLSYLKNLELEMYYSPDQSIKLFETLKNYASSGLSLLKETSDAVSHSSAMAHEEEADALSVSLNVVHA